MVEDKIIVEANELTKAYKIYEKKNDMVKEAFSLTRRKYHSLYYSLSKVSFQIKKGEMLGIIGENGAGKSTLLKLLTGVTKPTSGSVTIHGKIAALLELGAGFNPNYTGIENIYLNGTMLGLSRGEIDSRLDEIVTFADIGEFIHQPVKNYSSGMFARLAFAVAINVEPDVLIVDEALSVGDIFFQNKCFRRIEQLKENGVTILYVSHDLASVKEMCDRVLWLEKGNVKMFGDCVEVCNEYSNALLKNKDEAYDASAPKKSGDLYKNRKLSDVEWPAIQFSNESILSNELKIISCFFTDSNGNIKNHFKHGEPCRVSVVIDSKVELDKAIVGFAMATVKGVWVINLNSMISAEKKHIHIHAGKRMKVDFCFNMPALMPGEYVIEAAVCNGIMTNYKTYTWLYNIMSIHVENDGEQYAILDVDSVIEIAEEM